MAKPVTCRHCEQVIRRCKCVLCGTPGWWHWPSKYHRCGPDGIADTLAQPAGDEESPDEVSLRSRVQVAELMDLNDDLLRRLANG